MKQKVLFLCTGNSSRSQMAEGWLRHLVGERFEVVSAGTLPVGFNPYAVTVMCEAGVDISHDVSERVDSYLEQYFGYMITVCDNAQEAWPDFPRLSSKLHWNFNDPTKTMGNYEQQSIVFR